MVRGIAQRVPEHEDAAKTVTMFPFRSAYRPLACIAGLWMHSKAVRKVKEGENECDIFGFLTINPNQEIGATRPKAMAVILQTPEDFDIFMSAPWPDAVTLQRSLPDGTLKIVGYGAR